jgi:hypothetical protein
MRYATLAFPIRTYPTRQELVTLPHPVHHALPFRLVSRSHDLRAEVVDIRGFLKQKFRRTSRTFRVADAESVAC